MSEAHDASDARSPTDAEPGLGEPLGDGVGEGEPPGADPLGAPLGDPAELAAQLATATAERDDYLDQLQRARAEFANFRRRTEDERRRQAAAGVSRLVESLLPVLDGCDAATAQGHSEVAAVGQSLMVALSKAGLERIEAVGQPFDPNVHEAVMFEPAPDDSPEAESAADGAPEEAAPPDESGSDRVAPDQPEEPDQIVLAELRSGFRFEGRVLRAAMVTVRSAPRGA